MPNKVFIKNTEEYNIIKSILEGQDLKISASWKYKLKKKAEKFVLIDGKLYLQDSLSNHKLVIASTNTQEMRTIAEEIHDANHCGHNALEELCGKRFCFVKRDVIRQVVRDCDICQSAVPLKQYDDVNHIFADVPNERFQIDLIDLKRFVNDNDQFSWLLTVIDVYSRYAFTRNLLNKSGREVANKLEEIFMDHGPCKYLQSDNGTEFKNHHIRKLCQEYKIVQIHGRPNNPQSQGIVERFNQTITRSLSKLMASDDKKEWIKHIRKAVFLYNQRAHSSTCVSPFQRYRGIPGFNTVVESGVEENPKSFDMEELEVVENPDIYNKNDEYQFNFERVNLQSSYYRRMNRKMGVHRSKYELDVGDIVRVQKDYGTNPSLRLKKFEHPYGDAVTIVEKLSNNFVKVTDSAGSIKKVHSRRLKKFKTT